MGDNNQNNNTSSTQNQDANQDQHFDAKNIEINLDNSYKIIQKIDNNRSVVICSSIKIPSDINSDQIDYKDVINKSAQKSKNPQESRCHAFYRMIGLPVVDKDGNMYNPGYDKKNNGNKKNFKRKLKILNNIDPKLIDLMNQREIIYKNYLNIFGKQDISASGLALSSIDIRDPLFMFKKDEINPFDSDIKSQSYEMNNEILKNEISNLVDSYGNHPSDTIFSRSHILRPFMVDPRIEITVMPSKNIICVPFIETNSDAELTSSIKLERPYLEQVCRDRFNTNNNDNKLGDFTINIIAFIKNTNLIKNDKLLKKIFADKVVNPSDENRFANLFNTIRSIIDNVVYYINIVYSVRQKYNYYPVPDKLGPEFGCTTGQIINNDINNTPEDRDLVEKFIKKAVDDLEKSVNNQLDSYNINNDVAGSVFNDVIPDISKSADNSKEDIGTKEFDKLKEIRDEDCEKANEAIKNIEIIMGEFSGLGLYDIYAIFTALHAIDKKVLVSLLDDSAFQRMITNKELICEEVNARINGEKLNGAEALKQLETEIKNVYVLMDQVFMASLLNSNQ